MAWGPAAVWAAVLFFLSAVPDVPASALPVNDKVAHLGLYTVLGAALAWGRRRAGGGPPPHIALMILGVLYGMSDELHQAFVPGRDSSALDFLADTVGVLLGYTIVLSLFRRSATSAGDDS
jgi:VanZ family protein